MSGIRLPSDRKNFRNKISSQLVYFSERAQIPLVRSVARGFFLCFLCGTDSKTVSHHAKRPEGNHHHASEEAPSSFLRRNQLSLLPPPKVEATQEGEMMEMTKVVMTAVMEQMTSPLPWSPQGYSESSQMFDCDPDGLMDFIPVS